MGQACNTSLHPGKDLLLDEISRWLRKGCGGGGEDPPVGRTNTSARLQALRSTFDDFSPTSLAVSRKEMAKEGLAGYVVPSTDAHQVAIESIGGSQNVSFICSSLSMWLLRTTGEHGSPASLDPMGK